MPDATHALLVIDVQNDFCPGGALAVADGDAIVPGINALMDEFRDRPSDPGLASAGAIRPLPRRIRAPSRSR